MDNKLSELSKPVAWILGTPACKHLTTDEEYANWYVEKMSTALPLYSQEYVSALLTELEAKDKRIAELERANQSQDDHINQQQDRIDSLEKKNGDLGRSLGAAEKRLATPVRLKKVDSSNVPFAGDGFNAAVDYCADRVRAAGFTVQGDE
ncbi:hypothetical protein [Serratia marcescens]|uniref:hypothetical protein n=1 Tax=Serratia marcescens TaxID=615 RepID=UPI001126AC10|nr:hypothetical protein [Serratia marcescens]TPV63456.1 hypothetical protein FJ699_22200 [Serratia marcescens]